MEDGALFPACWKTGNINEAISHVGRTDCVLHQQANEELSLKEWLDKEYEAARRGSSEEVYDKLVHAGIYSLKELLDLPEVWLDAVPELGAGEIQFLLHQRAVHSGKSEFGVSLENETLTLKVNLHKVKRFSTS